MCDVRGHEHWCSECGKNLNKEKIDSYVEIEWSQDERGQINQEKSMICNECIEEKENTKEFINFFKKLEYPPYGHIFCSVCKKDLTKELGMDIIPGKDYECISFKCHEKTGKNRSRIKHIIKVVVLCSACVKNEFNITNINKLKKLGRNPIFKPIITCPNTNECKQYSKGDEQVNCKHIVIGRDRESLQFGILCGRKHKGSKILPFDDGFSIFRPRKKKGAALANPVPYPTAQVGINPMTDFEKTIEKLFKKFKIGRYSKVDLDPIQSEISSLTDRIIIIEKHLGIDKNKGNY